MSSSGIVSFEFTSGFFLQKAEDPEQLGRLLHSVGDCMQVRYSTAASEMDLRCKVQTDPDSTACGDGVAVVLRTCTSNSCPCNVYAGLSGALWLLLIPAH